MNQILKPKQTIQIVSSKMTCEVEQYLGGGGQGEVYQVKLDGRPAALKWYFPASATAEQRAALELLIKKGPPNDKFLWPIELATAQDIPGFGYIMLLRDSSYQSIVDIFFRRVDVSMRILTTACLNLVDTFFQLHSKGLCYRDISHSNIFFHPDTGDVLICDCDNVGINGDTYTGVTGTSGYAAPEIERHEAVPSIETDLHSLAVLLFKILTLHHPLEGIKETSIRCFDIPAREKLYGFEPVFIFDPENASNRPDPRYHETVLNHWPIYPQFLRELFTRAFTAGLQDPNSRVREIEWRNAMIRLRDALVYCPHCGAENFYDEAQQLPAGKPAPCWSCSKEIRLPVHIQIGKSIIMLNHDTRLFPHHIDELKLYDFSRPAAKVTRHPKNPDIWGLKNLSRDKWVCVTTDGTVRDVEPGKSITLSIGTKIIFGSIEGEIKL